jgi:uroporphyrinogen-III decarboxylase
MSLTELRAATDNKLAILGNIPPRDVLASGSMEDISLVTKALKTEAEGFNKMIFSCGGGMPPSVSTANINAFIDALK